MKRLLPALLVLGFTLPAQADIVVPRPRVRAVATAQLTSLRRVSSDAPAADRRAVLRELRAQLGRQRHRIDRCLAGLDLREDPLRRRSRTLRGRLTFDRSGRPTVQIDRTRGFPRAARACIEEGVRAVAVSTAPRGRLVVAFTYTLR